MKGGNLVVRLSFPYIDLPKRHEAFIERKLAPQQLKEEQAKQAMASPSNGDGSFTRPIPGQSQARNLPPPIPPQREQQPPKQSRAAQAGDDDLPLLE
jgi:hypothetical protein